MYTEKILSEITPVFGVCSFDSIKDSLIECRAKAQIPENAKSVIVALFPYNLGENAYTGSDISKYAVVPDYHDTIGKLLRETAIKLTNAYPDEKFTAFTDNSPVPEIKAAMLSGLGVRGLNGLFINPEFGSWVFIGEIITTKEYEYPKLTENELQCIKCGKCVEACPTHAINGSGIVPERCLSYITQKKGDLTPEQEELIKNSGCAWGCDICQNICPMNKNVKYDPIEIFKHGAELYARVDSDISDRAYAWRGEKVIKRNLKILEK